MTHDEMIAVIKATQEGEQIEVRAGEQWQECPYPTFNFSAFKYRVKPRQPREWWLGKCSAIIGNPHAYDTLEGALTYNSREELVLVREVID